MSSKQPAAVAKKPAAKASAANPSKPKNLTVDQKKLTVGSDIVDFYPETSRPPPDDMFSHQMTISYANKVTAKGDNMQEPKNFYESAEITAGLLRFKNTSLLFDFMDADPVRTYIDAWLLSRSFQFGTGTTKTPDINLVNILQFPKNYNGDVFTEIARLPPTTNIHDEYQNLRAGKQELNASARPYAISVFYILAIIRHLQAENDGARSDQFPDTDVNVTPLFIHPNDLVRGITLLKQANVGSARAAHRKSSGTRHCSKALPPYYYNPALRDEQEDGVTAATTAQLQDMQQELHRRKLFHELQMHSISHPLTLSTDQKIAALDDVPDEVEDETSAEKKIIGKTFLANISAIPSINDKTIQAEVLGSLFDAAVVKSTMPPGLADGTEIPLEEEGDAQAPELSDILRVQANVYADNAEDQTNQAMSAAPDKFETATQTARNVNENRKKYENLRTQTTLATAKPLDYRSACKKLGMDPKAPTLPGLVDTEGKPVMFKPTQVQGLAWLMEMGLADYLFGGKMLCDDCGLGKTFQALAYLASSAARYIEQHPKGPFKPSIVVCPASLTTQWIKEFENHGFKSQFSLHFYGSSDLTMSVTDERRQYFIDDRDFIKNVMFGGWSSMDPRTETTVVLVSYKTLYPRTLVNSVEWAMRKKDIPDFDPAGYEGLTSEEIATKNKERLDAALLALKNMKERPNLKALKKGDRRQPLPADFDHSITMDHREDFGVPLDRSKNPLDDMESICENKFRRLVLDEAHHVKSDRSLSHRAVFSLKAEQCLLLTATPLLNTSLDVIAYMVLLKAQDSEQMNDWRSKGNVDEILEWVATLPDGDPRLVNHNMYKYFHTGSILDQNAARKYFPRFLSTLMLRRTLGNKIQIGDDEVYTVGQEIPRQEIYHVQLEGNTAERSNYKRLHQTFSSFITKVGTKRGGVSGTDAGGVNWKIVRLMCFASFGTMISNVVESFQQSGVNKIKEWTAADDGGLSVLLAAACTHWNFDPGYVLENPTACLQMLGNSSVKLRFLAGILKYWCIERGDKVLILTDWPATTWVTGIFCKLAGISTEWIRSDFNDQDRAGIIERFNAEDSELLVVVGPSKLLGQGHNFQRCHVAVIMDEHGSLNIKAQDMGRINRFGQKHIQQVYSLFTTQSFDEKRLARSSCKMLTQMLAGGPEAQTYFNDAEQEELSTAATSDADLMNRVTNKATEQATVLICNAFGMEQSFIETKYYNYRVCEMDEYGNFQEWTENSVESDSDDDDEVDLTGRSNGPPTPRTPGMSRAKAARIRAENSSRKAIGAHLGTLTPRKVVANAGLELANRTCLYTHLSKRPYALLTTGVCQECTNAFPDSPQRYCFKMCMDHLNHYVEKLADALDTDWHNAPVAFRKLSSDEQVTLFVDDIAATGWSLNRYLCLGCKPLEVDYKIAEHFSVKNMLTAKPVTVKDKCIHCQTVTECFSDIEELTDLTQCGKDDTIYECEVSEFVRMAYRRTVNGGKETTVTFDYIPCGKHQYAWQQTLLMVDGIYENARTTRTKKLSRAAGFTMAAIFKQCSYHFLTCGQCMPASERGWDNTAENAQLTGRSNIDPVLSTSTELNKALGQTSISDPDHGMIGSQSPSPRNFTLEDLNDPRPSLINLLPYRARTPGTFTDDDIIPNSTPHTFPNLSDEDHDSDLSPRKKARVSGISDGEKTDSNRSDAGNVGDSNLSSDHGLLDEPLKDMARDNGERRDDLSDDEQGQVTDTIDQAHLKKHDETEKAATEVDKETVSQAKQNKRKRGRSESDSGMSRRVLRPRKKTSE